ncbi:hypothetical protein ACIGB8_06870 [Promicromonospora sukumoe]|uniref:hypothetical protein n=1 Tax=Promicromonospora sukumoe TaxID=88382 RepID=UPI0037C65DDB
MKLRSRTISALGAVVALASAGGLVALYAPSGARAAGEGTDSAVTVRWAGGNGDLQRFQPDRSGLADDADGSGHWADFKDLEVTVSQTEHLTDQAVTVTASGMSPTVLRGQPNGANNFLQVMQCWGADPNAADFAETCQWGGYSANDVGGSTSKASELLGQVTSWTAGRDGTVFRSVGGDVSAPVVPPDGAGANAGVGAFYVASTSNELPIVPVAADGTAKASFVVQTSAAQPYLGCGDPEAAGERCWLVVVPRGTHSGSLADGTPCMDVLSPGEFGEVSFEQKGSPVAARCTFWANRVVVPLDFDNPYQSCPPGSAERRVVGSELFAEASSSWQPALCAGDDGATFSLTTNSGDLARSQLLTAQADLAAVSEPLTPDTIGPADPALLDDADLRYAPLANTSVAIGFVADGPRNIAENSAGPVYTDVRLTPRLVAKLLTQSFRYDVPQVAGAWGSSIVGESYEFLGSDTIADDEEWQALGNPELHPVSGRAVWLVVGPQGDDAIRLLWEYVLADADAVEFLRGAPDPWDNTVNRYYLPPDHPDAAGGGTDLLGAPLDTFPKADRSAAPSKSVADAENRGLQLDSTAYSPYSGSFDTNAARVLRSDRRLTFSWDPNVFVGVGTTGVWSVGAPDLAGSTLGRLALGPVTAPAAELYGLNTARLALPLPEVTDADSVESAREFVAYDDATVAAAVKAQRVDRRTGVAVNDPGALPAGAYPLSTTLYGVVNLWSETLTADARTDYAGLLDHAAGDGNVHTGARGGLPEGYVPLTADQVARAHALADLLRNPPEEDDTPPGGDDPAGGPGGPDDDGGAGEPDDTGATVPVPVDGDDPADGGPSSDPGASAGPGDGSTTRNEAAATEDTAPLSASVALGGTLVAGLAGMVGAPFLMRRRELTG